MALAFRSLWFMLCVHEGLVENIIETHGMAHSCAIVLGRRPRGIFWVLLGPAPVRHIGMQNSKISYDENLVMDSCWEHAPILSIPACFMAIGKNFQSAGRKSFVFEREP